MPLSVCTDYNQSVAGMGRNTGGGCQQLKKNLYAIFVAEFIVLVGFQFVTPFIPLYIRDLGSYTPREAALWAGIASGMSGIAMFISAPLWGMLADRIGRKPMLLRAQFGSALAMALTGLAPNVYALVGLRFVSGLLAGTIAAATALVAGSTPREKVPFAMGMIMVALNGGTAFGPLLGGFLADSVGYRNAFFITSLLLLIGGFIVLFYVNEKFQRPLKGQGASFRGMWKLAVSRNVLILLLAVCALPLGPMIVSPNIPLFIADLNPGGKAATISGLTYCIMGALSAVSAVVAGHLANRISLKKMLVLSCIFTGLLYLPPIWAGTVIQLAGCIAMTGLFSGGIMMSVNSLVGLSAPVNEQGIVYGLATSAQSLGGGIGPFIGGPMASLLGFRHIFGVSAGIYGLVAVFVSLSFPGQEQNKNYTR
jgi:DHA1 family multidrug resistance protein-like MFS transporter